MNRKQLQKYFDNKESNYKAILSKIRKEDYMSKKSILGMVAMVCIVVLGATGLVFASTNIYKEYIKSKDAIASKDIFKVEDNPAVFYDFEITKNMEYNEYLHLYYKVITNMEEYNTFKNKENKLPELTENDFIQNAMIIVLSASPREPHETDLTISEVKSDETTSYIIVKQNNNPNYESENNMLYMIVDKTVLKENVKLEMEYPKSNSDYVDLEKLPENYSEDDALKDGCFVEVDHKVLSNNKYAIDEFLNNANNGEESYIRIYSKIGGDIDIQDLQYKDGIFVLKSFDLQERKLYVNSAKYMFKRQHKDCLYGYSLKNYDMYVDVDPGMTFLQIFLD